MVEPLSFETMDKKNMGNILKEPLSAIIHKWNWTEPLTRSEVMTYCNNMKKIENPKIPEDKKKVLNFSQLIFDTKKLLYVEGHKDYPYLDHKELGMAVIIKLALITCEWKDQIEPSISDEDAIQLVLQSQLDDGNNLNKRFTKKEMQDTLDYYILLNKERLLKDKGILGLVKSYIDQLGHDKEYYDKLGVNTYDK